MKVKISKYQPKFNPDETHFILAKDGWKLALHRYLPRGAQCHAEPVLLHHGMGANGMMFDLGVGTEKAPVPSLAHWLADRGYDVWVCDLRGCGASQMPDDFDLMGWNWSVDDFIENDDPAFVIYILSKSKHDRLHWVGHSLGGILLLCHCAMYGSSKIASGVAIASGFDYSGANSSYKFIVPLSRLGQFVHRVPSGTFAKLMAPLCGRVNSGPESWGYNPPNIAPEAARTLFKAVNHDVTGEMLHQLTTLFVTGGLQSKDRNIRFSDYAENIKAPILMMAGVKDVQFTMKAAERSYAFMNKKRDKMMFFGKAYGQADDYGHFDLVAGLRAESEVFPHILGWLEKNAFAVRENKYKVAKIR